jgi:S-adenosylhomocysteine hydrolase
VCNIGHFDNEIDIAALKAYPRGQVHQVTGEPGDMTATVHSEVDSSD